MSDSVFAVYPDDEQALSEMNATDLSDETKTSLEVAVRDAHRYRHLIRTLAGHRHFASEIASLWNEMHRQSRP